MRQTRISSPQHRDRQPEGTQRQERHSQRRRRTPSIQRLGSRRPSVVSQSLWKSPLLWLGLGLAAIVAGIPVIDWYRTGRVIAVLARDVSESGLEDPAIGQNICRVQTQSLKPDDVAIDVAFADVTEATHSSKVRNVTQLFPRCQDYAKKQRPGTVGIVGGTSPIRLLERIQTQVQIQRNTGNTNPISAVIWLQAAEPGPGQPPLNYEILGQQIQAITADRGRVTIIGPTGRLRENLEKLSAENSALQICSIAEHQSCIRNTFEMARNLPQKQ